MDEAVKWLEAQVQPPYKIEPSEQCRICLQTFDKAGKKYIHQRDEHGIMDGWLDNAS